MGLPATGPGGGEELGAAVFTSVMPLPVSLKVCTVFDLSPKNRSRLKVRETGLFGEEQVSYEWEAV